LGAARDPEPLIEYYGGMVFSGGFVTCPVDDPTPLERGRISIEDLPRKYYALVHDGILLFVAGKMGDKGPGAGCDGPIAKIARDFEPIFPDKNPVMLVDFKAGFEDSARGNVISLDWIIVVVDPTSAAIEMAVDMKEMVNQLKSGHPPATAHLEQPELVNLVNRLYCQARVKDVIFVLNRVDDEAIDRYMRDKLAQKGIHPISTVHRDSRLSMSWLKGDRLPPFRYQDELSKIIEALEEAPEAIDSRIVL
jgi:CO dehydrogenase nickel-insertion accessory protein CooC1